MPIEIQHTDDNIGIIFSAVGKVTGQEIIESQSNIYQSEGFAKLRYWIAERSRCTEYEVSSYEVSRIAEIDNQAAKINPNLIMALIRKWHSEKSVTNSEKFKVILKMSTNPLLKQPIQTAKIILLGMF